MNVNVLIKSKGYNGNLMQAISSLGYKSIAAFARDAMLSYPGVNKACLMKWYPSPPAQLKFVEAFRRLGADVDADFLFPKELEWVNGLKSETSVSVSEETLRLACAPECAQIPGEDMMQVEESCQRDDILDCIDLSERDRIVLRMRRDGGTLTEIGIVIDRTAENVKRILRGISKKAIEEKKLRDQCVQRIPQQHLQSAEEGVE